MSIENHPRPEIDLAEIDQRIAVVEGLKAQHAEEVRQREETRGSNLHVVKFSGEAQIVPVTVDGKRTTTPMLPLEKDGVMSHLGRAIKPVERLLSGTDTPKIIRGSRQHHAVRKNLVDKMADARVKRIFSEPTDRYPRSHGHTKVS